MADPNASRHLADFAQIADGVRHAMRRIMGYLVPAVAIGAAILFLNGNPAAFAFALISATSLVGLWMWMKHGRGVPLLALFTTQNLVIYGLPIVVGNEGVFKYSGGLITQAGWQVAACNLAMLAAWRLSLVTLRPASSLSYALLGFDSRSPRLSHLGITLLLAGSSYQILQSLELTQLLLDLLPSGSQSILHVITSATSACGFFLCGMMIGRRQTTRLQASTFWVLLVVQSMITASGFLLSATIMVILAATIGLFWGSGRLPWRFLLVTVGLMSFLNLGKFTMRERYWRSDEEIEIQPRTFAEMPKVYLEWAQASFGSIVGDTPTASSRAFTGFTGSEDDGKEGQSLLYRINNLENLLFAIDAVEVRHAAPLGGATYTLIPPLLVPRVLWPDKPRSHEGQVMLNVYFGRQDLTSTFKTYVAWGLLPEAYGNFGATTGAVVLGLLLGLFSGWVELYTSRKLVMSLEGFLAFTLFVGLANSFEMVASVLITSLFQAFVPVIIACAPFVARISPKSSAPPVAVES